MIRRCSRRRINTAAWLLALVIWASATGVAAGANDAPANDLDQARRAFQTYSLEAIPPDLKEALKFAAALRADGSWPDIDYQNRERGGWVVRLHLVRVRAMAAAARIQPAPSARQAALVQAVQRALAYWRGHDFQCPNWWYNQIGVPLLLGDIALILDDWLQPEDFAYITGTVMPRCATGKSTGQNRVWLAGCTLMDGLIRRDQHTVAQAAPIVFAEAVVVTGKEGVQADFSFHQHGPQQQFGNYGLSFATDQIKWMTILRGTPWAMSASQEEVVRHYLLDGLNWPVWRGAMDISCCGRQLDPNAPMAKGQAVVKLMSRMAGLDPAHAREYSAFLKRNEPGGANDLIGCRFFWRSDYLVQRGNDCCFTLKMCSARVVGSESLNDENLSGYYLGDGATYLYRTGDEYRDIFPVWDWRMIPGVTCEQKEGAPPRFGAYRLDTRFVGGVTDGTNGCAVLDYRRDGVSARKAWFLCEDQIVCLGSGVRAAAEVKAPLATTVNQCRLRGKVRIGDGKTETTVKRGVHTFEGLRWVEHDGVRYSFPYAQKVRVSNQRQTGSWEKVAIRSSLPREAVSEDVFTLSIEHGIQPKDGSYAYGISPLTIGSGGQFEIISNTESLQAVRFGSKWVAAVFHTPGRLDNACGHAVTADSPCVLLLNLVGSGLQATVADPTQSLQRLRLELDGKGFDVRLPVGNEAGKSTSVALWAER